MLGSDRNFKIEINIEEEFDEEMLSDIDDTLLIRIKVKGMTRYKLNDNLIAAMRQKKLPLTLITNTTTSDIQKIYDVTSNQEFYGPICTKYDPNNNEGYGCIPRPVIINYLKKELGLHDIPIVTIADIEIGASAYAKLQDLYASATNLSGLDKKVPLQDHLVYQAREKAMSKIVSKNNDEAKAKAKAKTYEYFLSSQSGKKRFYYFEDEQRTIEAVKNKNSELKKAALITCPVNAQEIKSTEYYLDVMDGKKRLYIFRINAKKGEIIYDTLGKGFKPTETYEKYVAEYNQHPHILAFNDSYVSNSHLISEEEQGKWEISLPRYDPKLDKIWDGIIQLIKEGKFYRAKVTPVQLSYKCQKIFIYNPSIRNIAEIKQTYEQLETLLKKLHFGDEEIKECIVGYKADYDSKWGIERYTSYHQLSAYEDNRKILQDILTLINNHEHALSSTANTIKHYIEKRLKRDQFITADKLQYIEDQLQDKTVVTTTFGCFSVFTNIGKRDENTVGLYRKILERMKNRIKNIPLEDVIKDNRDSILNDVNAKMSEPLEGHIKVNVSKEVPIHKLLYNRRKVHVRKYNLSSQLRYGQLNSTMFIEPKEAPQPGNTVQENKKTRMIKN